VFVASYFNFRAGILALCTFVAVLHALGASFAVVEHLARPSRNNLATLGFFLSAVRQDNPASCHLLSVALLYHNPVIHRFQFCCHRICSLNFNSRSNGFFSPKG